MQLAGNTSPFSSSPRLPAEVWSDDTQKSGLHLIDPDIPVELWNVSKDFLFVPVQLSSPNSIAMSEYLLGARSSYSAPLSQMCRDWSRMSVCMCGYMLGSTSTHASFWAGHAAILATVPPGGKGGSQSPPKGRAAIQDAMEGASSTAWKTHKQRHILPAPPAVHH